MAIALLFLPKILNMEQYGYFQLYLFYINYFGFLHLGLVDGVYLRFAGIYYEKLNTKKISGQFWFLTIAEAIIALVLMGFDHFVIVYVSIAAFLFLPRTFLQFVLQGSNRIKEYANLQIVERIIFCIFIVIGLWKQETNVTFYMIADLTGKLGALIVSVYYCKEIVFCKPEKINEIFVEAFHNIRVGIKLMVSNVASMLIIGIAQIAVEWKWNVETFGKISLTLYISNLLMILIRAIAVVIFPALKRTEKEKLPGIYSDIRNKWVLLIAALLIVYYPVQFIASSWIPQYADALQYMAILFPLCIFESKISMLTETYLKVYRKERELLKINLISLICSVILTGISVIIYESLTMIIFTILLSAIIRSVLAEFYLMKMIQINTRKDIVEELLLTFVFILGSFLIKGLWGMLLYLCTYGIYFFWKDGIKELKRLFMIK